MTTTISTTAKTTGLVKTGDAVRTAAARLERARQIRNEKHTRADAEYADAIIRAAAELAPVAMAGDQPAATDEDQPAATAAAAPVAQ